MVTSGQQGGNDVNTTSALLVKRASSPTQIRDRSSASRSRPSLRKDFSLLQDRPRRLLLLVRRVPVLAQDAPDQPAQVRPHVLTQRPVDGDVAAHGLYQLASNVAQCFIAEHLDRAVIGLKRVVESEFVFR